MSCINSEYSSADNDLDGCDAEGLKEAIKKGNSELVGKLLDNKADLQHRYVNGLTPCLAVVHEKLDVVRLLLRRKADPLAETQDECHLSPMQLAEVQGQQAILDVLSKEDAVDPCHRRLFGPFCLVLLIAVNASVFSYLNLDPAFRTSDACCGVIATLAGLCLAGLALANSLDPGTVHAADVSHLEDLRHQPGAEMRPSRDPTEEDMFYLLPEKGGSAEQVLEESTYRWCRSCKFWRPPGVSHCSDCRRCFWRMDHHCWAIGNCVARRNHRFFTLMVVCGATAWSISLISTIMGVIEETPGRLDALGWNTVIAVVYFVWSLLGLSFLVPFSLFHLSALIFNVTSKNTCGHRAQSLFQRRLQRAREYEELCCGPLEFRQCDAEMREVQLEVAWAA
ncbi:unnamed protein product [Effrenium voratum]|nr:unnamed protein product [Effrenium voratum]